MILQEQVNIRGFHFNSQKMSSKNVFMRLPTQFSPLERMILQATGNLQRLLSAYYNIPSHVKIIKNKSVAHHKYMKYERKIEMYFGDKLAYEAESILIVKDDAILELIEKHKYGLGQIFGHTHRSPDFVLHTVGRHGESSGASFWRDYSLTIPEILDCFIRETFVEGLFEEYRGETTGGMIWCSSMPE
ncbi:hypothetical protein BDB01DRAFT_502234 [Pilobolus umbonatus]|nr:hypothetical protein BDB01DRAFT_502234 [Pilobolus umbonatus]